MCIRVGTTTIRVCALLLILGAVAVPARADYHFVLKWGSKGSGDGQFQDPSGIAADSSGNIYVVDRSNHRIQKFGSGGALLTQWGSFGVDDGKFQFPMGVAVDRSGNVYVADRLNNRIQKFDPNGAFLAKWGTWGAGDGQFSALWGVAVDNSGNVYVADNLNSRIQKFDSGGNFVSKWGTWGSGDGQFLFPQGLAVDNLGSVYVADSNNQRIQKFDSGGNFVSKWGAWGSGDGQFNVPQAVAVDRTGKVFVADNLNARIQEFDSGGNFLAKWGSSGSGDGQFSFPGGVAVDGSGNVYVADTTNNRIQQFTPGPPLTGSLTGVIEDGTSHTVIADAAVVASSQSQASELVAVVDLNGEYLLTDLPAGSYTIRVFAPGYGEQSATVSVPGTSMYFADFQLTARTAGQAITGVVRDTVTSKPLGGVRVDAKVDGVPVSSTYTTARGRYELVKFAAKTTAVSLEFSGYGYNTETQQVELAPDEVRLVDGALAPKFTLSGSLMGSISDASTRVFLAGAQVTATMMAVSRPADTGQDGAYLIPGLDVGAYSVRVSMPGYVAETRITTVFAGATATADFAIRTLVLRPEDINRDGMIDAVDIQLVINAALGLCSGIRFDVNRDGRTDAIDVQRVINGALGL